MSDIPVAPDVLDAAVPVLALPEVAGALGLPLTRVHQMLREGRLLAVRRGRAVVVPAEFLAAGPPPDVVKGLPGTVTLLRDAGYGDGEVLQWLFRADDSLPGRPVDALRADRGREVRRRAQALAF